MNQTTVVVDVDDPWHTISETTVDPTMWQVTAHGDNGFDQLIDLFDTLDEAEEAYPDAVTLPNNEAGRLVYSDRPRFSWSDRRYD